MEHDAYAPRRAARAKRNVHISSVAERLFEQSGVRAITVDQVAAAAGVTKVTLYRHFATKEDLVLAALTARHERRLAELRAEVRAARGGQTNEILVVFDWLERWIRSPEFHGCTFVRTALDVGDNWACVRNLATSHKDAIATVLTEAVRGVGGDDPSALGDSLALLIEGATTLAALDGNPRHAQVARTTAIALLEASGIPV